MTEAICYKKPFLKDVIFKLDFSHEIEELKNSCPEKLDKAIKEKFPISEVKPANLNQVAVNIERQEVNHQRHTFLEWLYHGKNREKILQLKYDCISFVYNRYTSYQEFKTEVNAILLALSRQFPNLSFSRIGLRYINVINVSKGSPLNWKNFINKDLIGVLKFSEPESNVVARSFHLLEYNFDDINLKCQFGIANPDYPAPIAKKEFVIDLDAYSFEILEHESIDKKMDYAHQKIQAVFEKIIDNETRKLMEPANQDGN